MPKRDDPSTPTKEGTGGNEPSSPLSKQQAKRLFHGQTAMDVDDAAAALKAKEQKAKQQAKERDERRKRVEQQKKTGVKDTGGQKKNKAATQDADERVEGNDESTVAPEARGRGRSKSRDPPGQAKKPSRSTSRKRSDFDKAFPPPPKAGRRRSVPPPAKKDGGASGSSVDSSTSRKSKKSDSDDSQAGDKRKRESTGSTKSAKFQDGIPNNEGKTASTRKSAKVKKAATAGKTYADKAKMPEKTDWIYDVIMYYSMKVGKCSSTTGEVYSRLANAFAILHKEDPTCAIGNIFNAKKTPLRSPAEFNFDSHGKFQQHFTVDEETDWQFDDGIKQDKPRTFQGSFILMSDRNPRELLSYCRVDLRKQLKGNGSIGIKEIQELRTVKGLILMGVHGTTFGPAVANDLRLYLGRAEQSLLEQKRAYDEDGMGHFDSRFQELDSHWKDLTFPEIRAITSYPKGGGWEESKPQVWTLNGN